MNWFARSDFTLMSSIIYFDALTGILLPLIGILGAIILRYSWRYLDGEPRRNSFFGWMGLTLASVASMVIASNLLFFFIAWILTSFGLHQLLTFYQDRPQAIRTARKKFWISRLGDAFLLTALALTYHLFGTFDFREIFALVARSNNLLTDTWQGNLLGVMFVLGAMTKSAQVPFHTWLPDTLETPTPVSAIMHAGIINAGGILILRLSPLISVSHIAMDLLTVVGGITAVLGSIMMLTQSSIKRSLAYSTIAQMGFMMLQCGVGAYVAALLHLVSHSLYKAHAFLSSGSVIDRAKDVNTASAPQSQSFPIVPLMLSFLMAIPLVAAAFYLIEGHVISGGVAHTLELYHQNASPHLLLLQWIATLAIVQLLLISLSSRQLSLIFRGIFYSCALLTSYVIAYRILASLLVNSLPQAIMPANYIDYASLSLIGLAFFGLFILQVLLQQRCSYAWLHNLYVHAAAGFYLDLLPQRLMGLFSRPQSSTRSA